MHEITELLALRTILRINFLAAFTLIDGHVHAVPSVEKRTSVTGYICYQGMLINDIWCEDQDP